MSDISKIKTRLKLIMGTFNNIIDREKKVQERIQAALEEMIENIDGIEDDPEFIDYLDEISSFFIQKSQSYSDYCGIIYEDIKRTAMYFEEDVKYLHSVMDIDFDEFDLRGEYEMLMDEIQMTIPDIDDVVFIFNEKQFTFKEYKMDVELFLAEYEYYKKLNMIDDELGREYVKYCKSILYIKINLDSILENRKFNTSIDGDGEITEEDFKRMMGE